MEYRKYILCFLSLCSFVYINADTVLLNGITFSTSKFGGESVTSDKHFVLKTGLNIEKNLFKKEKSKELFKKLIACIKDNNKLSNDLKVKCNSTFAYLRIDKPEDIDNFFNNFYYKDISEGEYEGGNIPPEDIDKINEKELYLNLRRIHEIDYDIGNENIINDNIVKEIKELFAEYLNDNTHYPFKVKNMLNFYKKQLDESKYHYLSENKVNFSIFSRNAFYYINNQYSTTYGINKDLYIDYPLELEISLEKSCKIYKTSLNLYLNEEKKDTLSIDECYYLEDFKLENYKYLFINKVQYHLNLKYGDFTIEKDIDNRNVNINITNPSAIRYEIIDAFDSKHVIYSGDKLTEREIVNIIEKNEPEKYVLYENSARVDVDRKLENEKYRMEYSDIVYKVIYSSETIIKFHFYKKATYNELKKVYKKDLTDNAGLSKVKSENILDPNTILEPGDYHFIVNVKKTKENKENLEKAMKMGGKGGQCICCR